MAESMTESLEYAPALLAMAELAGADDVSAAIAYAQQSIDVGRTAELQTEAHLFMASALVGTDRAEAARDHAERALHLAERLGSPWLADQARGLVPNSPPSVRRRAF